MLQQYWLNGFAESKQAVIVGMLTMYIQPFTRPACRNVFAWLIPHIKDVKHTINKVLYVIIRHIIPRKDGDDLSHITLSVAYRSILLNLNNFLSRLG